MRRRHNGSLRTLPGVTASPPRLSAQRSSPRAPSRASQSQAPSIRAVTSEDRRAERSPGRQDIVGRSVLGRSVLGVLDNRLGMDVRSIKKWCGLFLSVCRQGHIWEGSHESETSKTGVESSRPRLRACSSAVASSQRTDPTEDHVSRTSHPAGFRRPHDDVQNLPQDEPAKPAF
jgi:hypothetical protein